ncbi:zf-TFIIB domain-containing protein [Microbacterium sp. zg.Y909]
MVDHDDCPGFSPTCARCLVQLEPALVRDSPVWRCPSCGLIRIS